MKIKKSDLIAVYFLLSLMVFFIDFGEINFPLMVIIITSSILNFANAARLVNKHYQE